MSFFISLLFLYISFALLILVLTMVYFHSYELQSLSGVHTDLLISMLFLALILEPCLLPVE